MATRAQLRTRARTRADQTDSTFPSDTEYDLFLDEGAKETWYDLIQAGWPINFTYADKAAASPIVIGASGTVAFVRGVFYNRGGTWCELSRLNEGDRASLMATGAGEATYYDTRVDATSGPVVELLPTPSSGTYRIFYVLEHPGFAGDSTEWYGPGRSDELIVLRSAAKAMRKEGNDQGAAQLDREYAMLLEKVQNMAGWFNQRHATLIRDVGSPFSSPRSPDGFDYDV